MTPQVTLSSVCHGMSFYICGLSLPSFTTNKKVVYPLSGTLFGNQMDEILTDVQDCNLEKHEAKEVSCKGSHCYHSADIKGSNGWRQKAGKWLFRAGGEDEETGT